MTKPEGGSTVLSAAARLVLLFAGALALTAIARPFGTPRSIQDLTATLALGPHAGECAQCHTTHAGDAPAPEPYLLIGPDDNTLCAGCHQAAWTGGSYAGLALHEGGAHGSGVSMTWPGPEPPARTDADAAGKCVNCHDPHGREDANGLVPALLHLREEQLCLTCHDGHPAEDDVLADLQKPYRHPVLDFSGRHDGPLESQPQDFGVTPLDQRHAECADCHNVHVSRGDPLLGMTPPDASKKVLGVSRVRAIFGDLAPTFVFAAGSDTVTAPVTESQLCYKCHSSWTTQPAGQSDLAALLNPNNPSYHPVEALGRNLRIDPASFTPGWSATSYTRCDDCHGSDLGSTRGPHGSIHPAILRRDYTASPNPRVTSSDEVCFACHSYDTYANQSSPQFMREASRFNGPMAQMGHTGHVDRERIPCFACHDSHGSETQPHLIAEGRMPGIADYLQSMNGGTCTTVCHGQQSYTVNYAR